MTELFRKLNWKGQNPALVIAAEAAFLDGLAALQPDIQVQTEPSAVQRYDFILAFAPTEADLRRLVHLVQDHRTPNTVLWFAYPKQTSKRFKSDLDRNRCFALMKGMGLEACRQVAIDEDWSALRYKPN